MKKEILVTFKLAFPVIVGQVGHIMMGVVDSVMVARVGVIPLAAASLSLRLYVLIMVLGLGITMALTPLVAEAVGSRQTRRCGRLFQQGVWVSLAFGVILAGILTGLTEFLPLLNPPPGVAAEAMPYLRILGASMIPFMLFQAYRQFSEGISIMWPAMILVLAANGLNAFLNWVFIYGNLGFPALGLTGAGLTTLSTRNAVAICLVIYVMRARKYKPFLPRFFPIKLDWPVIKEVVRIGLGSGFQLFFEAGAFSAAAIVIGWMGAVSLAAHQIALNVGALTYMFVLGIAAAAAVRVGQAKGEKSISKMRRAGLAAFILSAGVMLVFGVIIVFTRHLIPGLYMYDPEVVKLASSLLLIVALFQVSDGIQGVGISALRGLADVKTPTIIAFTSYWLIGLPAGYWLAFPKNMGAAGIWVGLLIGLTVAGILLISRFLFKTNPSRRYSP